MKRMCAFLTAAMLGGCGGELILTAPDAVGLPGEPAVTVVRVQRREIWRYAPPAEGAAVTARIGPDMLRSGRTDSSGYAAVALPAPRQPGRNEVKISHQDLWGDEATAVAFLYVMDPDRPVLAVDMDSLPTGKAGGEAVGALACLAEEAQILYVSQEKAGDPHGAHAKLDAAGLPDGPVIPWIKSSRWKDALPWRKDSMPSLAALRGRLPRMSWAVAAEDDEAEEFLRSGLSVLAVGSFAVRAVPAEGARVVHVKSWSEVKLPPPEPSP